VDDLVTVDPLPVPLHWLRPPVEWSADGALRITAAEGTDLFVDPRGAPATRTAPCLLGAVEGDWVLSARVTVDFRADFDAGVLVIYAHESSWAKLCFEYSPTKLPTVVSVVTRGISDDANAFAVHARQVWLRIARVSPAWAFHASADGRHWQLVRYFALDSDESSGRPRVGFSAQSPTGSGCTATFDAIAWSATPLGDIRRGD
jgi:regulation of enolase protein 1 (concanavalin A-like superfamily)